MRKYVHSGGYKFEILDKNESILDFHDVGSAAAFFDRISKDEAQVTQLRQMLASYARDVRRLDTSEVIREFAALVVSGRIKVIRTAMFGQSGSGEAEFATEERAATAAQPPPATTSWIEIYLIDEKGDPVAGEEYRIKLPDGTVETGKLDSFGHAEHYGINSGSCEISFPGLDPGHRESG
jgi:hypothetical protein